jgi:hypothetical protein
MKSSLLAKRSISLIAISSLLLAPAISSVVVSPAFAQVDEDDDGVPDGGVDAGAGGAYGSDLGGMLPVAVTISGLAIAGTAIAAYRLRKQ